MTLRITLLLSLTAVVVFAQTPPDAAKGAAKPSTGPLLVGVVSALNDAAAQKQGAALASWVKATTGRPAADKVFADYEALAVALSKGEVDLAVMGPLAYLRVDPAAKASLLFRTVRKGRSTYRAVLFAKQGSPLKNLDALRKAKNLSVGWVDPSSATGYILPKAELLMNKVDPVQVFVTQDFAGSHDAVCEGVAKGKWDVGATFSNDPPSAAAKVNGCEGALGKKAESLTVILSTGEIPNDVFVAAPSFPKDQAERLVQEAKKLVSSEAGKMTLGSAFSAEGVTEVSDADFAPVRKALDAFSVKR